MQKYRSHSSQYMLYIPELKIKQTTFLLGMVTPGNQILLEGILIK